MFSRKINQAAIFLFMLLVAATAWAASPPLINHQGRLLDGTDKPVADGSYTIIYSLFTQPTGGVAVWTETQSVTTKGGLFSTMLGSVTPLTLSLFNPDSLYLETQMQGEVAMTPRLRIGTVPSAAKSGRVLGDITTAPGIIITGDTTSGLYTTFGEKVQSGLQQAGSVIANGAASIVSSCLPTTSSVAIKTKGTGADKNRIAMSTSPDSAVAEMGTDVDGDGVIDVGSSSSSSPDSITTRSFFERGDKPTQSQFSTMIDSDVARLAIKTKGTSAHRTIRGTTDSIAATLTLDGDDDGDGIPEEESSQQLMPGSCSVAIKTKGTGAANNRTSSVTTGAQPDSVIQTTSVTDGSSSAISNMRVRLNELEQVMKNIGLLVSSRVSSSCNDTGAVSVCDIDDDGDGVADASVSQSSSTGGASLSLAARIDGTPARISTNFTVGKQTQSASFGERCYTDGDDTADAEITQFVAPTTCSVAINTKGTGADKGRVASVSTTTDDLSAGSVCDFNDGSGGGGGGGAGGSVAMDCRAASASLAIQTKGTSAKRVMASATSDTAGIAIDEPGVHVTMGIRKGWDGTIKGRVTVEDDLTQKVDLDADGNGFLSGSLGIGMRASHSIDVAGGAYCDGSNWVNASDVNLKENFQPVDGAEMLDKIDALPISRWNYKSESPDVSHIGPTAQDFKKVFGVGHNDKSISTIDPSGIALAAIKELNKQNVALKAQVADMQKQIDDLKKNAAQTDQLRAQIKELSDMVEMILGARNVPTTNRLASSK